MNDEADVVVSLDDHVVFLFGLTLIGPLTTMLLHEDERLFRLGEQFAAAAVFSLGLGGSK